MKDSVSEDTPWPAHCPRPRDTIPISASACSPGQINFSSIPFRATHRIASCSSFITILCIPPHTREKARKRPQLVVSPYKKNLDRIELVKLHWAMRRLLRRNQQLPPAALFPRLDLPSARLTSAGKIFPGRAAELKDLCIAAAGCWPNNVAGDHVVTNIHAHLFAYVCPSIRFTRPFRLKNVSSCRITCTGNAVRSTIRSTFAESEPMPARMARCRSVNPSISRSCGSRFSIRRLLDGNLP